MADNDQAPDMSSMMGQGSVPPPDMTPQNPVVPTLAPQPQQPKASGPPTPVPILASLITGLIHPQAQNLALNRPTSRGDVLENFLRNFVTALGQGFQVARGPGAAMRGAGAAVGAPYAQALQNFQLGQQSQLNQSELAQRQAQTQLTQAQLAGLPAEQAAKLSAMTAQPRFDPNTREFLGTMTDAAFANYVKGQGAAKQNALSKQAQADLAAGKVAKYLPTPDGRYLALDAKGNPLHVVDGTIDPQMLQRLSTTQQWLPDGAGGYISAPKTTVSGVVQPQNALGQLQSKVPAVAQNQTPQQSLGQKVPALGNARRIVGNAVGVSYDPTTNSYVQETAAEAQAAGHQQFQKITPKLSEENRQLNNRLADVAMKLTRYEDALQQPFTDTSERRAIAQILGEDKFKAGALGAELPVDWMKKLGRASLQNEISPAAQKALMAYYNARESMVGYQRVLSGGSKSNEKAMQLNLDALPEVLSPPGLQKEGFRQFKENVAIAGQGLPRMKGITSAPDILSGGQTGPTSGNSRGSVVDSLINKYSAGSGPIQQQLTRPWKNQ